MFRKYKFFPYEPLKALYIELFCDKHGPWSIGIYEGTSPFTLRESQKVRNPVISAEDITDVDAVFVSDPFIVKRDGVIFMFFTIVNRETAQCDIGCAESQDGIDWSYIGVVLDEDHSVSFPYVFEWDDKFYMIPETNEELSVRVYVSKGFPYDWEYEATILQGFRYADSSIFRHDDLWWLLTSTNESSVLNLYYSQDLLKDWQAHPMNPILKQNPHHSRPSGRVFEFESRLFRTAQDCYPEYGSRVFAFEILELSTETYFEKPVSTVPLLSGTGSGWNGKSMHHLDPLQIGDKWIAAVDGRCK